MVTTSGASFSPNRAAVRTWRACSRVPNETVTRGGSTAPRFWTTGGNYSDYAICLARTDPDVPKHAGLTMFIVPVATPGITVVPVQLTDGTADFCQEYIDDAVIPATT